MPSDRFPIPKLLYAIPSATAPGGPLWVVRVRPRLVVCAFVPDPAGGHAHRLHLWEPDPGLDAPGPGLLSHCQGLSRLALDVLDLPAPPDPPELVTAPGPPPEWLHLRHPGTGNDYVLESHTGRLWRCHTLPDGAPDAHLVPGYGPPLPEDLADFLPIRAAVRAFLRGAATGQKSTPFDASQKQSVL